MCALVQRTVLCPGTQIQLFPESKSEEQENDGNVALRVPHLGLILWIVVLFSFLNTCLSCLQGEKKKKSRHSETEIIAFGLKCPGYFILKHVNNLISIRTNS